FFSLSLHDALPICVIVAYFLSKCLRSRGTAIQTAEIEQINEKKLPSLGTSLLGPIIAILLLALRPLFDINIDPIIALPAGGLVGVIAMGRFRQTNQFIKTGLEKMAPVAILLIGTGTLAGIIENSRLDTV